MYVLDELLAFADRHLTPKPSEDEEIIFERSIYEDESAALSVIGYLEDAGVAVPAGLARKLGDEYSGCEAITDWVSDYLSSSATP